MTWLISLLYRALDPDERLAVEGDMAESGETGLQAFRQVLGLVIRREAQVWKGWRPWVSLAAAVPIAKWLTGYSRYTADHTSIYLWAYADNWIGAYLTNPGARADLVHYVAEFSLRFAMLTGYSALAGLALGSFSGRAVRIAGPIFCALLMAWQFAPTNAAAFRHRQNAAVFASQVYLVALPLFVQLLVVILPAICGMFLGRRFPAPRFARRVLILGAMILPVHAADSPGVRAPLLPASDRQPAPQIALRDSHGKTLKLDRYRGKIVLLDFWATWCHGCKQEIPWFEEFHWKYRSKGLAVVGISLDGDGWKVLRPFLENTMKIPYRIALGSDATASLFKIESMPDTFLIDREGRIAASYRGLVDRDDIEKNLQLMLAAK